MMRMNDLAQDAQPEIASHSMLLQTFNDQCDRLPAIRDIWQWVATDDDRKRGRYTMEFETLTYNIRSEYMKHSFPILCHEFLVSLAHHLKKYRAVAEIAAGTGWLSYWLGIYGVELHSTTDSKTWENGDGLLRHYLPLVKNHDAPAMVKAHPEVDLWILTWPYMDSLAFDVWKAMRPGQRLLYIGEGRGGCCADDSFFDAVEDHEQSFHAPFVSFRFIHDYPRLFAKGK